MIVRRLLIDVLLVYAVYVPSTARRTLVVASLMTVPLLGSIFVAFRAWDPALHDPPAATWPKGKVGDIAYPATIMAPSGGRSPWPWRPPFRRRFMVCARR